jgi:hypothetical protein
MPKGYSRSPTGRLAQPWIHSRLPSIERAPHGEVVLSNHGVTAEASLVYRGVDVGGIEPNWKALRDFPSGTFVSHLA